jgi:hypothetical protein
MEIGTNANDASIILMAAACSLLKLLMPTLMRINELPHTKASMSNIIN